MKNDHRFSRRQLFQLFRVRAEPTNEALGAPQTKQPARHGRGPVPIVRPPGAVEESLFLARCTKCNACVEACVEACPPRGAIIHAPARLRAAAGTPMIDPAANPCRMCEGLPCIVACPEAALTRSAAGPIATARLLDYNCLAHQGSFCTVCEEHCPETAAIVLDAGQPFIDEGACTGCGICQHVCPAPTNAIAIMPISERPRGD